MGSLSVATEGFSGHPTLDAGSVLTKLFAHLSDLGRHTRCRHPCRENLSCADLATHAERACRQSPDCPLGGNHHGDGFAYLKPGRQASLSERRGGLLNLFPS